MIITISIFLFVVIYIIVLNSFLAYKEEQENKNSTHSFSVIIAAKNEEKNLNRLLNSLANIDYPAEKYEIIFVDDNSTDATYDLLSKFESNYSNVTVIKSGNKELPGKKGALQKAVELAKYDFIVTTDADSFVPGTWLKKINSKITSSKTIVVGNVLFRQPHNFSERFATYDLLRNNFLIFALSKLNMPYTARGANFCYPKSLLNDTGGFRAVSQVLSGDDDLMLQKGLKLGYNITLLDDKEGTVFVDPPVNFKEHLRRKFRHVSTSNFYSFGIKIVLALWHILNLAAFYSFILALLMPHLILFFLSKVILDYVSGIYLLKKYGIEIPFLEIFIHQMIYEFLIPINYFCATFCEVKWKE